MTNVFSKSAFCVAPLLTAMLAVTASGQGLVEDFNTDGDGSRYVIEGRKLVAADNLWSTIPDTQGEVTVTPADVAFTNYEGEGYMMGADLDAGPDGLAVQFNSIDTSGVANPVLRIALAARETGWDAGVDFLRILADAGNTGTFEIVADVQPMDGDLVANGVSLTDEFADFNFAIPSNADLVLRVEAETTFGGERLGFDHLRVVPEPSSLIIGLLGMAAGAGLLRRRK